jgi:hypothetical protein
VLKSITVKSVNTGFKSTEEDVRNSLNMNCLMSMSVACLFETWPVNIGLVQPVVI